MKRSHVCNFVGDNALYSCNGKLSQIMENLVYDVKNVLNWFRIKSLKANPEYFQFMILGRNIPDSYVLNIDDMNITSTDEVTLLGVTIDNKLTFWKLIDELCRKASYKLHILRRIRPFYQKKNTGLHAPLIWMFAIKRSINY